MLDTNQLRLALNDAVNAFANEMVDLVRQLDAAAATPARMPTSHTKAVTTSADVRKKASQGTQPEPSATDPLKAAPATVSPEPSTTSTIGITSTAVAASTTSTAMTAETQDTTTAHHDAIAAQNAATITTTPASAPGVVPREPAVADASEFAANAEQSALPSAPQSALTNSTPAPARQIRIPDDVSALGRRMLELVGSYPEGISANDIANHLHTGLVPVFEGLRDLEAAGLLVRLVRSHDELPVYAPPSA